MEIKEFSMKYLKDVLSLWNETLIYDRITKERFENQILYDDNFDPALFQIAIDNNEVIGFVYGIKRRVPYLTRGLESNRGWIIQVGVKLNQRNKGIGKKLIDIVEKKFKGQGVSEVTLSAYSPNYFTPGVDVRYEPALSFFDSLGYVKKSDAVSMGIDLSRHFVDVQELYNEQNNYGLTIKPYEEKYLLDLLNFAQREFGGGWTRNILLALQSGKAENRIFIAVDNNDVIIGFVMRAIDGNETRFGPIGVASNIRSRGLGGALLETLLDDLIKRGIYYSFFLWTHGNTINFYAHHGFEIYRTYSLMRKEI